MYYVLNMGSRACVRLAGQRHTPRHEYAAIEKTLCRAACRSKDGSRARPRDTHVFLNNDLAPIGPHVPLAKQVVIYECGANYTDSDFVGETEVNSTSDYTGLVRNKKAEIAGLLRFSSHSPHRHFFCRWWYFRSPNKEFSAHAVRIATPLPFLAVTRAWAMGVGGDKIILGKGAELQRN